MGKRPLGSAFLACVAACIGACALPPSHGPASILGSEHSVSGTSAQDGKPLRLHLYEKRRNNLLTNGMPDTRRVVLLAHGATFHARMAFDLQPESAPGRYSLMDYLANRGFDVFALDYQNYGRSGRHACGLCVDGEAAVRDVEAAVEYIRQLRGVDTVHLLGWSWGATVAGRYAMRYPERVGRLILYAPTIWTTPPGKPTASEFRNVDPNSTRGLFEPAASDEPAVEAWISEVMERVAQAPNGVLLDYTKPPRTDPAKIAAPTMIIVGALDRLTPVGNPALPGFFMGLANTDKQLIVVPGAGHMMAVQKPRERFYAEVANWFGTD
jgi:alpha-beta hydrolase superfamily lysophospholipase